MQCLLGADAPAVSPNVVVRLKEKWGNEYEEWSRRDLTGKTYVYFGRTAFMPTYGLKTREISDNACSC